MKLIDFWSPDLLVAIQGITFCPCIFLFVPAFSFLSLHFHFCPCIFIKISNHVKTFWRILSILSLRSSLLIDLGLDSFESCYMLTWQEKKGFKLSSTLFETWSENLLLMIVQYKTPKVSLLCFSTVQKYGKESCWELTICVLQQTSINNDQIIWCLCVLAMGDLFSDCHSKLWHYRERTIVCKNPNNGVKYLWNCICFCLF